jgi:hypothetical protein
LWLAFGWRSFVRPRPRGPFTALAIEVQALSV